MAEVVSPPAIVQISGPVIFLAGPIQGAPDWQKVAIKLIQQASGVTIANPRRHYLDGEFDYAKQVDWETNLLNQAAENGVILFWLAKEEIHDCDRAFAQTSRFELAEWKVRHQTQGTRLVIGIEPGFTNERYIRRRFGQDCPAVQIFATLKETVKAATELINGAS